jgi:hypothetical protein
MGADIGSDAVLIDCFDTHGALSGQVGTHGVLSAQVGTHGVLSAQVGTHGAPTSSAVSVLLAVYSHMCAHTHACAAGYTLGPANTNACLAGSAKITDVTACPAAAAAIMKPYVGSLSHAQRPSGCYLETAVAFVYFNPSAPGGAFANAQPLCRVTGAPPPCTPQGYTVGGVPVEYPGSAHCRCEYSASTEYPVSTARVPSTAQCGFVWGSRDRRPGDSCTDDAHTDDCSPNNFCAAADDSRTDDSRSNDSCADDARTDNGRADGRRCVHLDKALYTHIHTHMCVCVSMY